MLDNLLQEENKVTEERNIEEIAKKIASIMSEITWLDKEADVQIGNRVAYSYTTEAQFIAEVRPLMVSYGVIIVPIGIRNIQTDNAPSGKSLITTIIANYRFIDVDTGQYIDTEIAAQGADAGDKGIFKALTGAYKYCMRQTFLIGTGDDP